MALPTRMSVLGLDEAAQSWSLLREKVLTPHPLNLLWGFLSSMMNSRFIILSSVHLKLEGEQERWEEVERLN